MKGLGITNSIRNVRAGISKKPSACNLEEDNKSLETLRANGSRSFRLNIKNDETLFQDTNHPIRQREPTCLCGTPKNSRNFPFCVPIPMGKRGRRTRGNSQHMTRVKQHSSLCELGRETQFVQKRQMSTEKKNSNSVRRG